MGVHANLLIACTQVAGETGLTGIVIFLTEIEPQHGTTLCARVTLGFLEKKKRRNNGCYTQL